MVVKKKLVIVEVVLKNSDLRKEIRPSISFSIKQSLTKHFKVYNNRPCSFETISKLMWHLLLKSMERISIWTGEQFSTSSLEVCN